MCNHLAEDLSLFYLSFVAVLPLQVSIKEVQVVHQLAFIHDHLSVWLFINYLPI